MLSLSHTLISLPFGIYLHNPFLIFVAAFVFHLFTDTLLHWNIYPWKFKKYPYAWVGLDIIGGLFIAWAVTGDQFFTLPVLAAIIGGNAPDVMQGLWDLIPKTQQDRFLFSLKPFFIWHDKLQLETPSAPLGLLSQVILICLAIFLI